MNYYDAVDYYDVSNDAVIDCYVDAVGYYDLNYVIVDDFAGYDPLNCHDDDSLNYLDDVRLIVNLIGDYYDAVLMV